jgi:hypothetical protein
MNRATSGTEKTGRRRSIPRKRLANQINTLEDINYEGARETSGFRLRGTAGSIAISSGERNHNTPTSLVRRRI